MDFDTDIGGPRDGFPRTHHSAVRAAGSDDARVRERAWASIIEAYWKPLYKYVRLRWRADNEEAKDLTQGFFASAMERRLLDQFDPERAAFRTYLRTCLDGYVANERKAARRLRRGGDQPLLSLDFDVAESEFLRQPAAGDTADYFEQEWVRHVFALALDALRRSCEAAGKTLHYRLFERYDLHSADSGPTLTYAQLADEFDLPITQVTNFLAWTRREFRALLLGTLREVTATEAEFREEAKVLLGPECL